MSPVESKIEAFYVGEETLERVYHIVERSSRRQNRTTLLVENILVPYRFNFELGVSKRMRAFFPMSPIPFIWQYLRRGPMYHRRTREVRVNRPVQERARAG